MQIQNLKNKYFLIAWLLLIDNAQLKYVTDYLIQGFFNILSGSLCFKEIEKNIKAIEILAKHLSSAAKEIKEELDINPPNDQLLN